MLPRQWHPERMSDVPLPSQPSAHQPPQRLAPVGSQGMIEGSTPWIREWPAAWSTANGSPCAGAVPVRASVGMASVRPGTASAWTPSMLTPVQRRLLRRWLSDLKTRDHWHGELPVALLDRCWLRLEVVPVQELARRLPPDASAEAPELVRYRDLVAGGLTPLEAQERCWHDYGLEACRQAQTRFWTQQDQGNHGWTLQRYLELIDGYRSRQGTSGKRALPLVVLARASSDEAHTLHWLC